MPERGNYKTYTQMILEKVIRNSGCAVVKGCGHIDVSSVCADSRKVSEGALFVAVKGFATDGHEYISAVIGKGARVIVYEDEAGIAFAAMPFRKRRPKLSGRSSLA